MNAIEKRPAAPDEEMASAARVADAKARYRGPNGNANLSAALPLAVDRMIDAEAPRLADLNGQDFRRAHREAEELPERFDPW